MFGIHTEVNSLAARVRGRVPERLARIVPHPPLALHVVGIGNLPVWRAGQWNPSDASVFAHAPETPRREVEIRPPDFLRFGDVFVGRTLRPDGHALGPAEDGLAVSPSGVARQPNRI